MKIQRSLISLVIILAVGALMLGGCADNGAEPESVATAPSGDQKIPVTTASEEARKEFLQGRDLAERLLGQNSLQHFDRAISMDPDFALAELGRANASPTPKEFFEHLNRAVSLSGKVSEGERLLILGSEAGANGNPVKQREYFEKLVASFPGDERAHSSLGNYFFGQQDYARAIQHYRRAIELAPGHSIAYNMLGYAHRQTESYDEAEKAFKKYTELIPNDPNPYDSYAELLLKMGRHDESIEQYRKALTIDPNFVASRAGIAANLMYSGKPAEAEAELQKITENARNDGERRAALFVRTVLAVDSGKMDAALKEVEKQLALAEKNSDAAAMAGDLQTRGNLFVEMGRPDEAKKAFERALEIIEGSALSEEIKENARLFHHYNLTTVALKRKDLAAAKGSAGRFREGAEQKGNRSLVRQAHELLGMIVLDEKDYDGAIAELEQASRQNSYNLYRLGLAYDGKGEAAKAAEYFEKAAEFNPLPSLNHAFIRKQAGKLRTAVTTSQ